MKKSTQKGLRKAMAVVLTAVLIVSSLSVFSVFTFAADEDKIPEKFDNPVIKTDADGNIFFSADPSVRVFDGKLYMYPSHDIFPAQRCDRMDKYHVFSSTNGQDWKDEGEILSAADVKWGEESGFMWAPDCEKIGDKYYFFYPHKLKDGNWQTGVAISDTPVGPFKDLGPIEGTQGAGMIDPNVLVDGDKAYLYWGGSQKLYGAELNVDGEKVTLGEIKDMTGYCDKFHEGSWVFKKDDKYYMTYASSDDDGGHILAYSVGDSPLGEFEYKGTMLSANEVYMDTSHGSVVEYKGEWLIFYHNMALSGFECLRSVCADHLTFKEDGTINTVTPSVNTAPPVNKTEPTNAKMYPINDKDWTVGADASVPAADGPFFNSNNPDNVFVQNMHVSGAYYETKIIDGGDKGGKAKLHFRYSTFNEYAAICVAVNGESFDPAPAAPNGEWEDFTNYTSTTVTLKPGMNTLRITGGYGGVNVSAVYVEMLDGSDTPQDTTPAPTDPDKPQDTTPAPTDPDKPQDTTPAPGIVDPMPTGGEHPAPTDPDKPQDTTPAPTDPDKPQDTTPAPTDSDKPQDTTPAPTNPVPSDGTTVTPAPTDSDNPQNTTATPISNPITTNPQGTIGGGTSNPRTDVNSVSVAMMAASIAGLAFLALTKKKDK